MKYIVAITPIIYILYSFFNHQSKESQRKSKKILLRLFLGGALLSVSLALLLNFYVSGNIFDFSDEKDIWQNVIQAFVIVAFMEEFSKYVVVRYYGQKYIRSAYGGILAAVFVSLGFAFVENMAYVNSNGLHTALSRFVTAVPAHAIFGVLMGYYIGVAVKYKKSRWVFNFAGLFLAVVFHGFYDFFLYIYFIEYAWIGMWVTLAVGLILSAIFIKKTY